MNDDSEHDFWAVPLGAGVLVSLLITLALVAAGGWKWFADFLTSSASGWAQAVGTVLAVLATAHIARRDQGRQKEQQLLVAEFTAGKITGYLDPIAL